MFKEGKEILEVRWHGRGGQGVKTASYLLGETFMELGKYIQAFPEYGPERSGAPVTAYTRVSDNPIQVHSPIVSPDVVIVVDASLIPFVNVLKGMRDKGIIIINTKKSPKEILEDLKKYVNANLELTVATVDATGIALETIKRPIPNVPLLGAFSKVTNLVKLESLERQLKESFSKKFPPEVVEANVKALSLGYEKTTSESFKLEPQKV